MSETLKVLKDLNLNFDILIRGKSYLIKPNNLLYEDIQIVLIKGQEDKYEISWWYNDDFAKTITFKQAINILNSYNSIYQYAIRTLKNNNKHEHIT